MSKEVKNNLTREILEKNFIGIFSEIDIFLFDVSTFKKELLIVIDY